MQKQTGMKKILLIFMTAVILLAAAVIYTGFKIMRKDEFQWDEEMRKNLGYDEDSVKAVGNKILEALTGIAKGPYKAIKKKYTTDVMGGLSLVEFPEHFD